MENAVILGIVVAVVVVAAVSTIKHFTGKGGGCCGGGSYRPRKKKLDHVIGQKTFFVEGMTCPHCKARVEEEVNDLCGVAARVELKKGELTVLYSPPVADTLIRQKVEHAGYRLVGEKP